MLFLRPSDFNPSMNVWADAVSMNVLVCPPLLWPSANQAHSWSAIYQLAYEQLIATFALSPFQRMIEPSAN
jgi:hypothetical protein